jgi:hypothetical protein
MASAGVYTVLCQLHPNELGFIVVSPSSYFAKADKAGKYEIPNIPAGKYTLVAWAPKVKPTEQTIDLRSDLNIDLELRR